MANILAQAFYLSVQEDFPGLASIHLPNRIGPGATRGESAAAAAAKTASKVRCKETTTYMMLAVANRIYNRRVKGKRFDGMPGRHWARSLNALLPADKAAKPRPKTHVCRCNDSGAEAHHGLRSLPKEVRHQIEGYLLQLDVICLRQICHKLRHQAKESPSMDDLNALQRYALRSRLDRDGFFCLQVLKVEKRDRSIALCSFCVTLHDKTKFAPEQLKVVSNRRVCIAASTKLLVMGNYSTEPTVLRQALRSVLSTSRYKYKNHHWMPARDREDKMPMLLAAAIDKDNAADRRRSSLFVDATGLVVEHHFHLPWQFSMATFPYYHSAAVALVRESEGRYGLSICPHHTISSGMASLKASGIAPEGEFQGVCTTKGCRTSFARCACRLGGDGTALCFKVQRRFGWVEKA